MSSVSSAIPQTKSEINPRAGYRFGAVIPFALLHIGCFAALFVPFRKSYLIWAIGMYVIRMFGVTAGYHRYFSHRSFKMGRIWQFFLALLAETSAQKGVLWWAAHHRVHHRVSDKPEDIHSPMQRGFWWSHIGWIISNEYDEYDPRLIQDFAKFPELVWLDRYFWVPPTLLGSAFFLFGGLPLFVWGFVISSVALFHCTFSINSLAHVWGSRRFETPDDSRNNFVLALITLGEGWHNNHHRFMHACRQGLRWWEIDFTFYALSLLRWFGITRELRPAQLPYETRGQS